jgi:hypothetical protein
MGKKYSKPVLARCKRTRGTSSSNILLRLVAMGFATSQIQAACQYSPPPLPNQGQGADTLGQGRVALAGEAGWGTTASWWDADNMTDVDVNSGVVGAARARLGLSDTLDVGVIGGVGPQRAFVVGPEVKWRFARMAPSEDEEGPAFHAAVISGVGIGASDLDYKRGGCRGGTEDKDSCVRHVFLAPYAGVTASGGIEIVQMFVGLRFAASEVVGNGAVDLTLFPLLAFGAQFHPSRSLTFYAEGDLGGGITAHDFNDSAVFVYPSVGLSFSFDGPESWRKAR